MEDLKERMVQDMKLRGFTPGTQRAYLDAIWALAAHYQRSTRPASCAARRSKWSR
jgi:hypothetical protein